MYQLIVIFSDSSLLPEELANQSVRLKEEQLRREEEKVGLSYANCITERQSDISFSSARSSSKYNVNSMRKDRNYSPRKSHLGKFLRLLTRTRLSPFIGIWKVALLHRTLMANSVIDDARDAHMDSKIAYTQLMVITFTASLQSARSILPSVF